MSKWIFQPSWSVCVRLRAGISKHDSVKRFSDLGIDVFLGQAEFLGSDTVAVGDTHLKFRKAVIATGARASAPPLPGLEDIDYLTNENLFSLTELPKRLGVIGAGPIGVEMAQSFARFGSEVYLVESMPGILPREDRDAAEVVNQSILRDGVKVLCCGKELQLSKAEEGGVRFQVESHDQQYDHNVDQVLVSVGRAPNTEGLGLEKVGVQFNAKGIRVNDHLQTTNPNIYAAGDVCMKWQFTHAADFAARIVIQNTLFKGRKKLSALNMPWCTYSEPEVAHVGLYEQEAKERGIEVDTFVQEMSGVDRAIADGETEGFVKVHTRKGKGTIVGATIVAPRAGDLISEISTAMAGKLSLGALANVIHPYPTQAEAIRKVGDAYNRTPPDAHREKSLQQMAGVDALRRLFSITKASAYYNRAESNSGPVYPRKGGKGYVKCFIDYYWTAVFPIHGAGYCPATGLGELVGRRRVCPRRYSGRHQ